MLLGLRVPAPNAPHASPPAPQLLQEDRNELAAYLTAPPLSTEATALFQRATRAVRAGQPALAEQTYVQFAQQSPALADWAYVFAADAAARRGDTADVRKHQQASSVWLAREWGWRARVRVSRLTAGPLTAAQLALSIADSLQLPAGRAQARHKAAELLLLARDTAAARETLRALVSDSVDASVLVPSAALLARLSSNGADLLQCARVLLAGGEVASASELLPHLLKRAELAGPARAQFRLELAEVHFQARRYPRAEKVAAALALDASEPVEARAAARLLLGRSLLRRGQQRAAITQFERALASAIPDAVAQAAFALGDLEHDDAAFDQAARWYLLAAQQAPASASGGEALMRLGAAAFARSRYDSALHWFEQARSATTDLQRAAYWLGRTRLALGDTGAQPLLRQLVTEDPISYYAWRAGQRLQSSGSIPVSSGPAPNAESATLMQRAFGRWELLRSANLNDAASFELSRLRRSFADTPETLYELAEQMHANGRTQNAISIGRELERLRGQWDQRLLRIVYPLPFEQIIETEARLQGIDPYLAAALIRQESGFNPRATSVAGARGLMQIMPRTGRKIARTVSIRNFRNARLYEPALNVKLGMQHLKELLDAYDSRLPYVLVAYNAGPNRLAQWRAFPEAIDDELLAERIPFSETRDYVRIVQQNASIYRALYGGVSGVSGVSGASGRTVGMKRE